VKDRRFPHRQRLASAGCAAVIWLSGCSGRSQAVRDPIAGIPEHQQRTVTRSDFDWRWPFAVGTGTLVCDSGAVVFRSGGTNYALNDAASARGYTRLQDIWLDRTGGPPSNPLGRLKQETRVQIFAQAAGCRAPVCRDRIRAQHAVSEQELAQIEAEGQERFWPPLERPRRSLAPLLEAGLKLCTG